ncbi:STAS domain-containing protein [Cryptosporangium minutisporangium]|uniref:STAS domain-containing protein n=1 Tax=Cryptosporangium minutisporangium TaxID=113569 RepID=A0ABP6T5J6_9ACTN
MDVLQTERPEVGIPVVELCLREAITSAQLPTVRERVDEVLAIAPRVLVLDLSQCPAVDAAGIAYLVDLHRRMRRVEGRLELRAPGPRIDRMLRLTHLDRVLPVVPRDHDARPSALSAVLGEESTPQ